ncbi:MAG: adenylate/guanylate cyclase domain-containing protein [Bacteroidales bacterium]
MVRKILLVADSRELKSQLESLNTHLNGTFRLQHTGERNLLKKVREVEPDYILIDSSILYKGGKKIFQLMKENNVSDQVPVILLTNDPEKDDLFNLLNLGLSDFLLKPLNLQELISRLDIQDKKSRKGGAHLSDRDLLTPSDLEVKSSVTTVVCMDPNGTVDWVNDGFEEMYGYPFREYLEKFGHYIFSGNTRGFELVLNKFRKKEKGLTFEHQIYTRSSEPRWIQTILSPLFDGQGELKKIFALETDISGIYTEKKKTEHLLSNILPFEIIEQLKINGTVKSKKYKRVSVLFADFKNFTRLTKTMAVDELISELNRYIQKFDEIIEKHYIEKIKTIGDAYMCAGGLPMKNYSNPFDVTLASLEIQNFVKEMEAEKEARGERPWQLRLGIHTGEVMAGVIGSKKFAYDIWGNTVNIAARMEETSQEGRVNVSGATYEFIKDYFDCTYRGKVRMKNNPEEVDMYFVNRLKPEYCKDESGILPNDAFQRILAAY